jgi:hypothetical protein
VSIDLGAEARGRGDGDRVRRIAEHPPPLARSKKVLVNYLSKQ